MSFLEKRTFPYSDIEVTIVCKADILETIAKNITDPDVANELISHIEITAEKTLRNKGWAGFPYLGSIRIPPGLTDETLNRNRDAKEYAYQNLDRKEYLMFMRQEAYDNHAINKYRSYFDNIAARAIRANKIKYSILCSNKGPEYAKLKIAFNNCLRPIKTEYECLYELNNEDGE